MGLVLRLLSIVALLVCLLSLFVAGSLYWEFNYGDCAEGCAEGMAYALTLPALFISLIAGGVAFAAHRIGKNVRAKADD